MHEQLLISKLIHDSMKTEDPHWINISITIYTKFRIRYIGSWAKWCADVDVDEFLERLQSTLMAALTDNKRGDKIHFISPKDFDSALLSWSTDPKVMHLISSFIRDEETVTDYNYRLNLDGRNVGEIFTDGTIVLYTANSNASKLPIPARKPLVSRTLLPVVSIFKDFINQHKEINEMKDEVEKIDMEENKEEETNVVCDKTKRVLAIYTNILNGALVKKNELAKQFHVDCRTIQRDIEEIRSFLYDETVTNDERDDVIYDRLQKGYRLKGKEEKIDTPEEYYLTKALIWNFKHGAGKNGLRLSIRIDCFDHEKDRVIKQGSEKLPPIYGLTFEKYMMNHYDQSNSIKRLECGKKYEAECELLRNLQDSLAEAVVRKENGEMKLIPYCEFNQAIEEWSNSVEVRYILRKLITADYLSSYRRTLCLRGYPVGNIGKYGIIDLYSFEDVCYSGNI